MREIERAGAFKRDYKRESKGTYRTVLIDLLKPVIADLAADIPLAEAYSDHNLTGPWASYRECHIKPDLLLIYQKEGKDLLRLVRLGSHSELF